MMEKFYSQLMERQGKILDVIKNVTLTHEQKVMALAKNAENFLSVIDLPEDFADMMESGIICDLGEGQAPYAPRYIVPDYEKLMTEGCKFLRLDPPRDLYEAVNTLLIFYKHVPSVTHFPVYIGNIDYLLEPFITDEAEAKKIIKNFLLHVDRTISDSFCHANIGPRATKAGRIILEVERELQNSTPNITLKYDPDITPDDFALECIKTALNCAKPSFANHKMYDKEFKDKYAIASCYNGLKIGGGAYTLSRLILKKIAERSVSKEDFIQKQLPHAIKVMCSFMDARIDFLINESKFFESDFLVKEGFIHRDNFTGMFGIVGMAETVNILLEKEGIQGRFGHSKAADDLGIEIMEVIEKLVGTHKNPYCEFSEGKFLLHGQVGIDSDQGVSPATRIPIGEEPELYPHLRQAALFHKYFPSGTGDIFPFDTTANKNLDSILDILKGAWDIDIRYLSIYSKDSDVIRITGYLVKKSDIEKLNQGIAVQHDTVALGLGAVKNCNILQRKVR
ncbi:YjjI family glycine radical enzyme [Natronincola ferrireducens]|uniref:Glycine radical enzyme, YjjI family n=1 Tax=Natronincola ferrireducens TaxID=393762 RepID=A0A1G9GW68_9FIRM|nr:YjjI family glycine radical enzyme [Natronincola ferrireducens]SDL04795.1 glycine radical enzyme, YjjI family [Natronincola ferrireducens]